MTSFRKRSRLACAGILAAAAIGSAAPAHANADAARADCDVRLERLVEKFYEKADKRGYEAATKWWDARWQAYHKRCVIG